MKHLECLIYTDKKIYFRAAGPSQSIAVWKETIAPYGTVRRHSEIYRLISKIQTIHKAGEYGSIIWCGVINPISLLLSSKLGMHLSGPVIKRK